MEKFNLEAELQFIKQEYNLYYLAEKLAKIEFKMINLFKSALNDKNAISMEESNYLIRIEEAILRQMEILG